MNADRPLQLYEKIQFLQDKIDFYYQSIKQSSQFELKMKFIQFIDTSIERICVLDNKKQYSSEVVRKKYQEYYNAEENDREKRRIEMEKLQLNGRIKDLSEKEKQLEVESLRIQLENNKILKEKMNRQYSAREIELKTYILQLQKKMKSTQRQFERVVKLNSAQAREIQVLKQERNKSQKRELQWRDKYQAQIGTLQTFGNKKNKYLFRHQQGLRIYRNVTNATTVLKGCERILLCDLPIKFHVAKIVYGIKIGHILVNREVNYFNEVSLYERQEMLLHLIEGTLRVQYIKRKVTINLEKYAIINSQVIIMLFGKGDSIAIDQSG